MLYDRHAAGALRLARVITRDDHLAADAVQEAFLRAYIHRNSFKPDRRFELWISRIVVNESRRLLGRARKDVLLVRHSAFEKSACLDNGDREKYTELYQALEELPEILRTVVALKYGRDLSEREVARVLGIRQSTVKSRLYQARQKLKQTMQTMDDERRPQ